MSDSPSLRALRARGILSRAELHAARREQLLWAMVVVAANEGFEGATVARVIKRAGVSRTTFYELFDDRDDCYYAALEAAFEYTSSHIREAVGDTELDWTRQLRIGLTALLGLLDREPTLARMCIIEMPSGQQRALEIRQRALEPALRLIDSGRLQPGASDQVPRIAARAALGSVQEILFAHLTGPQRDQPVSTLLNEMMYLIVAAYLGTGAAERQLAAAPQKIATPAPLPNGRQVTLPPALGSVPLTRLQHDVLTFISANPGMSNRKIGTAVGIDQESKVSRHLATLTSVDLVKGERIGRTRAWRITKKGKEALAEGPRPRQAYNGGANGDAASSPMAKKSRSGSIS